MAKISKYNMLFQDVQIQLRRPNVLNVTESKSNHRRSPFFLPKLKANETSSKTDKHQQLDIEPDVRGLGRKADVKSVSKRTKRNERKTKRPKNKINGLSSPSNKITDQKSPELSLPPVDSKSLKQQHIENFLSCSNAGTSKPYREFEIALNTLIKVIERSKEEQKRTTERFQRSIVQGEQKPINEKLQSPEEAKSDCSPASPE